MKQQPKWQMPPLKSMRSILKKWAKSRTILMMAAFYSLDIKIEKAARVVSLWKCPSRLSWEIEVIAKSGNYMDSMI
ncbi:hypothetical protein [Cytobacillus oceanisediminis]|uniref:hypothetical protein n=1 Tax=Cytobacillus oceanisediminis TaxID=665099 RepID=UPI00204079AB|nr:hypothetical protein [Cytobacillus oceanisediminis]MCM3394487.1 hypothetical protein [Cytobacillus oceanisediminis]